MFVHNEIKIGLPQIIEVAWGLHALYKAWRNNGRLATSPASAVKILAMSDKERWALCFAGKIASWVLSAFWLLNAWWGGCTAEGLLTYALVSACMLYFITSLHYAAVFTIRHNFIRSLLTQAMFAVILYFGGFYTVMP